jgi:Cdc6-like AAA superfamily ATPase
MDSGKASVHTRDVTTRRERFREYMARLRPAENPARAIAEGLYVPHPSGSAVDEIITRLELEPSSAHLIVGGIGSGKTTQLLVTERELNKVEDTRAIYIDISEIHDISKMKPGVLVVVAGVVLARLLTPEDEDIDDVHYGVRVAMQRFAHGHVNWVRIDDIDYPEEEDDPDPYGDYIRDEQPPFLAPPRREDLLPEVEKASDLLRAVWEPLKAAKPHLVLLFDSLDRLTDMDAFGKLIEQDIEALRKLGIGVVLAGPLRMMYGAHRLVITERFEDNFYPQMAVDVMRDEQGRRFLIEVLHKRVPPAVLPDEVCLRLVESSGGVLRDLISLTRASVEGAFRAGSQRVEASHAETAARAFGGRFLFGLRKHEIDTLLRLQKTGIFIGSSDDELALVTTQRILAYAGEGGSWRYAIHPTLVPLLSQLKEAS